jgi:hypothetical protein
VCEAFHKPVAMPPHQSGYYVTLPFCLIRLRIPDSAPDDFFQPQQPPAFRPPRLR